MIALRNLQKTWCGRGIITINEPGDCHRIPISGRVGTTDLGAQISVVDRFDGFVSVDVSYANLVSNGKEKHM